VSYKRIRLLTAFAVLCLNRSTWGQGSEADTVRGELHSAKLLHIQVTLTDLHGGRPFAEVPVGGDGRFEFRHVPYGEYRLAVMDGGEHPLYQELIAVHEQQPIEIMVASREEPRPAGGLVTAQELLHPPAKKAFKAFVAAQKLSEAGEHEKAAVQLAEAVRISPDYAAAWINLGAQHIFLKRFEDAVQDLTRAAELSRPTAMLLSNLAFAQYSLHRYEEATQAVRQALRLDPEWPAAHYLLGGFLVRDARTRAEGLEHMATAARVMPAARADLERLQHESVLVVTHP
jgi:tetratricopeptide (TPR) repeat protein